VTREFSAVATREDDLFVAQCLDVDVASQGASEEEALDNLREALELYYEDPATAAPRVRKVTAEIDAAKASVVSRGAAPASGRRIRRGRRSRKSHEVHPHHT
jgi:predicted RNase H-like HicB family nuclease